MQIVNIHECRLSIDPMEAGSLLDTLASPEDRLWPGDHWPAMRLDRPLGIGATGGHGPIGYRVDAYQPGTRVRFRFTAPPGFNGHHWFEVLPSNEQGAILRHTIDMQVTGRRLLSWLFIIRPLHDALVEDAFYNAEQALGLPARRRPWSLWVRVLRRVRYRRQMPKPTESKRIV
jgi:hypothetical protein